MSVTFPEHFLDYSTREIETMRCAGANVENFNLGIVTRVDEGIWHYCVLSIEMDAFTRWAKAIHGETAYVAFL